MQRIILMILGVLCLLAAVASFPLPIPLGIVFFVIGISLLAMTSVRVRRLFHKVRQRYPSLDARLRQIEVHLPATLRQALDPKFETADKPGGSDRAPSP